MKQQARKRIGLLLFICLNLLLVCVACQDDRLMNGQTFPNIELPDTEGNNVSLSTITNKMIWVEFWASWCAPCREKHPQLVSIYEKYKDTPLGEAEGLAVYSVSLDDKKDNWLRAIEQDSLFWPHHVSDLKGFDSPCMERFQFDQIPTAYLIDEKGVIVGKDITYNWLAYELKRRAKLNF